MSLRVLDPGLFSLIVDRGRPRCRSLGVPVGGAADQQALAIGNGLVGNEPDAPALEMSLVGPRLRAESNVGCVVYGASATPMTDRQRLRAGKTFNLQSGEVVEIGVLTGGARAYFCVHGGFEAPLILGSRSSLQAITANAMLPCQPSHVPVRLLPGPNHHTPSPVSLHALDGPQAAMLNPDSFYSQTFRVTDAANRMGVRLAGTPLAPIAEELVSEPACTGTVQVTPDGQCVVLGVDAQSIGGYPKIAQVIRADLDAIGQLRPGQRIRFLRVDLAEAQRLFHLRQRRLHEWLTRLRTTFPSPTFAS